MEKSDEDKTALSLMAGEKIEYKYANAEFDLSPDSFWELFTKPSLEVMLHYSVNSYTDEKVEIKSPLAVAAIAHKYNQAAASAAQEIGNSGAANGGQESVGNEEVTSSTEASSEEQSAVHSLEPAPTETPPESS